MTRQILSLSLIAVIAISLSFAFADEQTVDVPFVPDNETCLYQYDELLNLFVFNCQWSMTPTDEEIVIIAEDDPELIPENVVDAIVEQQQIVIEKPKPKTTSEIKIEQLIEKWIKEGELPSHEGQLLRALQSYQDECELGTEEGAPIQTYELFTIATYEPYLHTDLGTKYLLKQIELAIQECKSQQILKKKILGAQYLNIPGLSDVRELWKPTAVLPEDAQAKYDEAKMYDYFAQQSIQFAEQFQCSSAGKSRGLCVYDKMDQVEPEPTISAEGKAMLKEYKAYLETGIAEIPKQAPEEEFDPTTSLEQYIRAYGISEEELKEWYESRNP